jgi:UDP-2-acetamido-3-amino-2,3-dideoxy-glucuronate N-acetyltransferase
MTEQHLEDVFIHPSAVIDEPATIGRGTKVWHFSHVMSGSSIGEECVLGQNTFVAAGVRIGNRVRIQNNVSVYEGVTLADDVFCGPSCVFTNVSTPRATVSRKDEYQITPVGRGASIGANATIVCGNSIGEYALIGAGSVVTSDVPNHAIYVGVPARLHGWACVCGDVITTEPVSRGERLTCEGCGRDFEMGHEGLSPRD